MKSPRHLQAWREDRCYGPTEGKKKDKIVMSFTLKHLGAFVVVSTAAAVPMAASASPGSGITPTTYVTSDLTESVDFNHNRVKFQTKDPTTVRVQKLEFAPGGHTGFHHHPGVVIVSIQSGSLTLVDGNCGAEVHGAGSVFVEGEDHVHEAVSPGGATAFVTYIVPRAYTPPSEKFRVEEPVPFCATSMDSLSKEP